MKFETQRNESLNDVVNKIYKPIAEMFEKEKNSHNIFEEVEKKEREKEELLIENELYEKQQEKIANFRKLEEEQKLKKIIMIMMKKFQF